ncbi:MAG: MIP/aquaporin family protein [Bacteroidota bacterium]
MKLNYFLGELIGTFILVLFGCGAVAGATLFGAFTSLLEVALIWGIGVALGIFASRNLSQAHLNPAVSVAMLWARKINRQDFGIYLAGQFAGAFLAGLALLLMFQSSIEVFEAASQIIRGDEGSQVSAMMFGEYYPNPAFADKISLSLGGAIAFEAFGTFVLVMMIFFLTEKADQIDNFIPFMIGLTVTIIITLVAPFTQAGLNPARDFGPRMVAWMGGWGNMAFPDSVGGWLWVYILGPVLGGILAAILFQLISKNKEN